MHQTQSFQVTVAQQEEHQARSQDTQFQSLQVLAVYDRPLSPLCIQRGQLTTGSELKMTLTFETETQKEDQ